MLHAPNPSGPIAYTFPGAALVLCLKRTSGPVGVEPFMKGLAPYVSIIR